MLLIMDMAVVEPSMLTRAVLTCATPVVCSARLMYAVATLELPLCAYSAHYTAQAVSLS